MAIGPDEQRSWQALETAWMRLAESYSFGERLGDFIGARKVTYAVAIVDDDPAVRTSLGRLLRASDFRVRSYASAREFLESISSGWPECLLLDVNMPEMTGYELHLELSRIGASVPTIMITGNYSERDREQALAAGAVDYLQKPMGADTLLGAIKRAIGHHQPTSPLPSGPSNFPPSGE